MPSRILVLGDFHMPERAKQIPQIIWDFVSKQEFDSILCTGDLTSESALIQLTHLGPVKAVRGNMDYLDLPDHQTITIDDVRIGMTHGHVVYPRGNLKQLFSIARNMNVDVLVTGHTHSEFCKKIENTVILNPGSCTGAWGGGNYSGVPSFIMLEILEEKRLRIELYQLIGEKLKETSYVY
ncbi:MAG: YfcE family phosphodiesterase [Candidatus Hodarchaeota archaeon]